MIWEATLPAGIMKSIFLSIFMAFSLLSELKMIFLKLLRCYMFIYPSFGMLFSFIITGESAE